jgi:hypothetical protein
MMNIRRQTLGLFLALCTSMAFGQATNSADVTGTVTDTTGAVIPDVKVTVKDLDKGLERIITTNGAGLYDSGPVVPLDRYTVTFSKEGFGSLQRGPMTLPVGTMGLNVQLSVGKMTQQVVVNESAPLLETTTAELSATLPVETLQTLPQTGTPDWQSFLVLLPGTSGNPSNAANPGMGGVAANGSMPFSTAMLDGANISSPMSNNVINTPIFDIIGEVKMSDSSFSAQYGTGGIIYNQISKGGSNTIHGLVYDYLRNTDLNAAAYGFGSGRIPPIHYNDYGFQGSGPILKNKVFALFDYDHAINHGSSALTFLSVPTAAMMTGDFTGLPTLYDPTTQVIDPVTGFATRQSFAAEYNNGNKIPQAMLDKVALNIQKIYGPLTPNKSGIVNNYSYLVPSQPRLTKWFGRIDGDITSNNRVTGSAAYNYTITPGFGPVAPVNVTNNDVENMSGQLSDVHTFSAHAINEARAGWMGEYDLIDPATRGTGWPTKLGLLFGKNDIFPNITISGFYGLGSGVHANYKENIFDLSDVFTLIQGRHTLHFGGEFIAFRADSTAWGNITSAGLGFTGVYTALSSNPAVLKANPGTGLSYADFLLGYAQNWNALYSPEYGGRLKDPAAFVQDDFKVTPKLTLNLGLRWDGRTGWSDSTQNERSFDPTITNPATNTLGAEWYAATHTNGRTQLQANKLSAWWPRVGVAYQLGDKTTIRSGFGMYTFPWNVDNYASCCLGNARSSSGNETDSTGNVQPVVILSSDGNTNYQGSKGSAINSLYLAAPTTPQAYNGQAVSYMMYDQPLPRLNSWNLTVQRQLTGSMVADVAYVGSSASNLLFNTDLNQVPVSLLAPNDAASRPYPQYQAISGFNTKGQSFYSSFQGQIERRLSNGLMFNFNYTWSHMTDNQDSSGWGSLQGTTIWQNAYVPAANHGAANFDARQMFKAFGTYDLPFGRGRKFANNSDVLDEAIGGWTLSATWLGQTGHPFTPYMLVNNSYASAGASSFQWFPNQVGNPKTSGQSGTIQQWFNDVQDPNNANNFGAYQAPNPGTLGNMRRNSVYGPGQHVMNASIRKTFRIWERVAFDFSANATNVLNHASFANPDPVLGPNHHAQITGTSVGGRQIELIGKLRF